MKHLIVIIALTVAPALAAAQTVTLAGSARTHSLAASSRPRLSADAHARLDERITAAAEQGLPTAPLLAIVAEGEAKFITESRITARLSRLAADMQEARRILMQLGRSPSDGEVTAGGWVLGQGLTTARLTDLVRRGQGRPSLEAAFTTLTARMEAGEDIESSAGLIEAQLAAHAPDSAIVALAPRPRPDQ